MPNGGVHDYYSKYPVEDKDEMHELFELDDIKPSWVPLLKTLSKLLKPESCPKVIRRKDEWLDNRSILEVLQQEGPGKVEEYLHKLFSYSGGL